MNQRHNDRRSYVRRPTGTGRSVQVTSKNIAARACLKTHSQFTRFVIRTLTDRFHRSTLDQRDKLSVVVHCCVFWVWAFVIVALDE